MKNSATITATAKRFSASLNESSPQEASALADEMLLFLYRLRDNYQILKSSRAQFSGRRFSFLDNVIYGLESNPEAVFASSEYRELLVMLFGDLASGKLIAAPKN